MADINGTSTKVGNGQISLNMKDLSDWLKIIALLIGLVMAYSKLSYQVAGHTQQIENVTQQIGEMRKENEDRNESLQRKIGAIEFYLCSKDSTHCGQKEEP
jgi:hypothetical protein